MSKKLLRKQMIQELNNLDEAYKKEREQLLYNKFLTYIEEHHIDSVGIILSMPHEINTDPLITKMLESGIKVYNPVCNYNTKTMSFYPFTSFEEVTIDDKGIRVPPTTDKKEEPSLIIVPGLIFSTDGYRIGYGGGFYDRYLSSFIGQTVSIALDEQIGPVVTEAHDMPVDAIITPTKRIIRGAG